MRPTQWYLRDLLKRNEMTLERFGEHMKKYYNIDVDLKKVKPLIETRYFRTKPSIEELT